MNISLLSAFVSICFLSVANPLAGQSEATPSGQTASVLQTQVSYSVQPNEDIVSALTRLAQQSAAPIDMEFITRHEQENDVHAGNLLLPPGDYKVEDVLSRFKRSYPALGWTSVNGTFHVEVPFSKETHNPFNDKVTINSRMSSTISEWFEWLAQNDTGSGVYPLPDPIPNLYSPDPLTRLLLTRQITLPQQSNVTVREIIDQIAGQCGCHWIGTVTDRVPEAIYEVVENGQHKLVGSWPNNIHGRTRIKFIPLRSASKYE